MRRPGVRRPGYEARPETQLTTSTQLLPCHPMETTGLEYSDLKCI